MKLRSAVALLVAPIVITFSAKQSHAAGVVGSGTPGSCTDAALNTALSGGGLVSFNCGAFPVTIDISTGTGTKTISADTTIDGGGVIAISGGNSVGVFVNSGGVNFTVQNLTIANGTGTNNGGAIVNNGRLTVTNSTFTGNSGGISGGAIANHGALTITNSTFANNAAAGAGGAIASWPAVVASTTIINSTFTGNSGGQDGGAIANDGTLTITNSTFAGNSGGGGGGGGAINISSGTITVTNSTFKGNSSGSSGGAISTNAGGPTTIINTILANNTALADTKNCAPAGIIDGGHNLDDGTSCGFSIANGSLNNTDPKFDPAGLRNYGGLTETIALEAGSPAINAGDENVCAVPPVNNLDQRGYVRPGVGATNCSIGAYEFNSVPATPSPTPTNTPGNTPTINPNNCCQQSGFACGPAIGSCLTMVANASCNGATGACSTWTPTPIATPTATRTSGSTQCCGDCNGDGTVTIDEIITAVNNALNECPAQ